MITSVLLLAAAMNTSPINDAQQGSLDLNEKLIVKEAIEMTLQESKINQKHELNLSLKSFQKPVLMVNGISSFGGRTQARD